MKLLILVAVAMLAACDRSEIRAAEARDRATEHREPPQTPDAATWYPHNPEWRNTHTEGREPTDWTKRPMPRPTSPDDEVAETRWWCATFGNDQSVGSCLPTRRECQSDRERMLSNAPGRVATECVWQPRVACFTYRNRLLQKLVITCAPSFKTCNSHRDYVLEEQKDDIEVLTDCGAA